MTKAKKDKNEQFRLPEIGDTVTVTIVEVEVAAANAYISGEDKDGLTWGISLDIECIQGFCPNCGEKTPAPNS